LAKEWVLGAVFERVLEKDRGKRRAAHPPEDGESGAEEPSHEALPPEPTEPGAEKPSDRDLPKAS